MGFRACSGVVLEPEPPPRATFDPDPLLHRFYSVGVIVPTRVAIISPTAVLAPDAAVHRRKMGLPVPDTVVSPMTAARPLCWIRTSCPFTPEPTNWHCANSLSSREPTP